MAYFSDTAQRRHEQARQRCYAEPSLSTCRFCFDELVTALTEPDRRDSVDTFIHNFHFQYPHVPCPSVSTVYRYIDQGLLAVKNADLPMKLRRRIKNSHPVTLFWIRRSWTIRLRSNHRSWSIVVAPTNMLMAYFAHFPKDKSMDSVIIVDVQHAQYGLNHHYPKLLGYLCPADYYHELSTWARPLMRIDY